LSGAGGGGAPPDPTGPAVGASRGEAAQAQRLARIVFGVLVIACFAAFAATQRLKHTPTAVQSFQADEAFRPAGAPAASCRGRVPRGQVNASKRIEYLSFKPTRAETVTAEIIDPSERYVATIVRDLPADRYKQLSLCWNGQRGPTQNGGLAPAGEYRLRVRLNGLDRTVNATDTFKLEGRR
jgi:hypothetical protein